MMVIITVTENYLAFRGCELFSSHLWDWRPRLEMDSGGRRNVVSIPSRLLSQ